MHYEKGMIHSTAIIDKSAEIASDVSIGPYTIIGAGVTIDAGSTIGAHAVISGKTSIGKNNEIFHHVSLGERPQDKKYKDEPTKLVIGDNNTIREFCTINTGTSQDKAVTTVGSRNWIMAYVHVAHDCVVGDDTILANCTQLAGHVEVGDFAILGGFSGIHQFCRIGAHALTGVGSVVLSDVPPYVTCMGNVAKPHGVNLEGLKRRGFQKDAIKAIRDAYKTLYRKGLTLKDARDAIDEASKDCEDLEIMARFLHTTSNRSIVR